MHRYVFCFGALLLLACDRPASEPGPDDAPPVYEASAAATPVRPAVLAVRAPPACSDTAAVLLARSVILAAPILFGDNDIYLNNGAPLKEFAMQFRQYFQKGGTAIRCAAVAGPKLFAEGIRTYDRSAYDRVMSSAPPEIAHLSQSVANRINESSLWMFELGQELTWLSQVLPFVAAGDLGPFANTGYAIRNMKRQQITMAWPSLQAMCAMGDCREILAVAMPEMKKLVDEVGFGMIYAMIMLAG